MPRKPDVKGFKQSAISFNAIFCSLFLSMLMASCKKDKDGTPPQITFYDPPGTASYRALDTILVSADVSDETRLESVEIILLNANMIPVAETIFLSPPSNKFSFSEKYIINNIHLASGGYYIKVSASDGINTQNAYRGIFIREFPREMKSVYGIAGDGTAVKIVELDTVLKPSPGISWQGDYAASAISSYHQMLYVCGGYNGQAAGVRLDDFSIAWIKPSFISSSPIFSGISCDEQYSYLSYWSGTVTSFFADGSVRKGYKTATEYYHPLHSIHAGEYLIVEELDITLTNRRLLTYSYSSGAAVQECVLNQQVLAFYEKDANSIFIFGNENSRARVEIFDVPKNDLYEPQTLAAGKIISSARIGKHTYLLGFDTGIIYKYDFGGTGFTSFIPDRTACALAFDEVNYELFVAEKNMLFKYSYPSGKLLGSSSVADSVYALHVMYNK